jgi:hypothetical protein
MTSPPPEEKCIVLLRRALLILGFTFLFTLLAIFPMVGYYGMARINSIEYFGSYAYVKFEYEATYNPSLYPASWVFGKGVISGNFTMITLPLAYKGEIPRPVWGSKKDILDKAMLMIVIGELKANLPTILLICLIIEVIEKRILHLMILSGIVGFFMAEVMGAFIGLATGVFMVIYIERTETGVILRRLWYKFWK